MTVELFYDCEKFHDCGTVLWLWKNFLTAEKIIGLIVLKQWRHIVFDCAVIRFSLLILSVLTWLDRLMVKIKDYQHMGLLRMQVQNQWEASSLTVETSVTVEHLLQGG